MQSRALLLREEAMNDRTEEPRYSQSTGSLCPWCGKEALFRSHRRNFLESSALVSGGTRFVAMRAAVVSSR